MGTSRSVLISGAGIGGPALAGWLLRQGWAVTLVERAPGPRTGGYMIDVWGVGYDALERMGLLQAARERGYDLQRLVLVDARGESIATIDACAFRSALAGRFFSVPRGELGKDHPRHASGAGAELEDLPARLPEHLGALPRQAAAEEVGRLRGGDEVAAPTELGAAGAVVPEPRGIQRELHEALEGEPAAGGFDLVADQIRDARRVRRLQRRQRRQD